MFPCVYVQEGVDQCVQTTVRLPAHRCLKLDLSFKFVLLLESSVFWSFQLWFFVFVQRSISHARHPNRGKKRKYTYVWAGINLGRPTVWRWKKVVREFRYLFTVCLIVSGSIPFAPFPHFLVSWVRILETSIENCILFPPIMRGTVCILRRIVFSLSRYWKGYIGKTYQDYMNPLQPPRDREQIFEVKNVVKKDLADVKEELVMNSLL